MLQHNLCKLILAAWVVCACSNSYAGDVTTDVQHAKSQLLESLEPVSERSILRFQNTDINVLEKAYLSLRDEIQEQDKLDRIECTLLQEIAGSKPHEAPMEIKELVESTIQENGGCLTNAIKALEKIDLPADNKKELLFTVLRDDKYALHGKTAACISLAKAGKLTDSERGTLEEIIGDQTTNLNLAHSAAYAYLLGGDNEVSSQTVSFFNSNIPTMAPVLPSIAPAIYQARKTKSREQQAASATAAFQLVCSAIQNTDTEEYGFKAFVFLIPFAKENGTRPPECIYDLLEDKSSTGHSEEIRSLSSRYLRILNEQFPSS